MTAAQTSSNYRICTRCIMDTSDSDIEFDADGVCSRCTNFLMLKDALLLPVEQRDGALKTLVEQIKAEGRGKDYDCIIGVSGGVDSTYTAYIVKNLGLRPLAVHLDNGWDAELAVANIEKCLKILGIDLYTCVLDWDEFRELQLAFLKSSTPDSEAPTDHAINAILKHKANELGVRYLLMGNNLATEGLRVTSWTRGQMDWKYIRTINKLFGTGPLKSFPHYSIWRDAWLRWVKKQKSINILNYVDYHKEQALRILEEKLGYVRYQGKHHESVYTRFYQSYILPRKFGFDKARAHLSALVMSGQITRDQALHEMTKEIMPEAQMREDKIFVAKKLGLTEKQFDDIMALPKKSFWDYPSYEKMWIVQVRRTLVNWKLERQAARRSAEPVSSGAKPAAARA